MVVIAVLGILTAMVIPSFGGTYRDALLRSCARGLAAAASLAHSQAVTTGSPCRLRLDAAQGRWWLEARRRDPASELGAGGGRSFAPLANVPGSEGRIPNGIAARVVRPMDGDSLPALDPLGPLARGAKEVATLDFRPDGTAEAQEIVLADEEGFTLAVRIHPATSRVQVVAAEGRGK
jgi:type II secretory pathway pseudopilin PulG